MMTDKQQNHLLEVLCREYEGVAPDMGEAAVDDVVDFLLGRLDAKELRELSVGFSFRLKLMLKRRFGLK